ncbi:MAG: hypothetical protein ABJO67_06955 [Pseudoruegeria sp.]
MPDRLKVFLHVGAHKTASTHFQKILENSADALAQAGVRYVGPSFLRSTGLSLRRYLGISERGSARASQAAMEELAGDCRCVFLSEENLLGHMYQGDGSEFVPPYPKADLRIEQIVNGLPNCDVNLLLSVRDPASYFVSTYSQALMRGDYRRFSDFASDVRPEEMEWSNLIRRLRLIPDLNDLFVWRHEDYPAVLPKVFGQISSNVQKPSSLRKNKTVHGGLSRTAVAVALTWAEETPDDSSLGKVARRSFPVGDAHPAYSPWPQEIAEASARAYEDDLNLIADENGITLLRP